MVPIGVKEAVRPQLSQRIVVALELDVSCLEIQFFLLFVAISRRAGVALGTLIMLLGRTWFDETLELWGGAGIVGASTYVEVQPRCAPRIFSMHQGPTPV